MCHERGPRLVAGQKQAEVVLGPMGRRTLLVPEGPGEAEAQLLVDVHHSLHGALRQDGGAGLFLPTRRALLL